MTGRTPFHFRRHTGFTLLEVLITTVLTGILLMMFGGSLSQAIGLKGRANEDRQAWLNQSLAGILLDYARTVSPTGLLPAPVNSGAIKYGLYDSDANMRALLQQASITPADANGDGTAADNIRVYQRVSGLTMSTPLYAQSGPAVTLNYEVAAVYTSRCARADSCNTVGTGGIPGDSGALSSANLNTFALTGNDYGLAMVTTLSLQKQMLAATVQRLDMIRDRAQEFFREKQRLAAASDASNHYELLQGAGIPAAAKVGTTTDCGNGGWYRLDNSPVLAQLGLQSTEYGLTAWGGQIHICLDYDSSTPVGTADSAPHYAALRISKNPVVTLNPSTTTPSNNVILSF